MSWSTVLMLLTVITTGSAINRPVYKIILTQIGFAQFLQYDVETPPMREFTICVWIRPYTVEKDQTIFAYVANGSNRIIRLWIDSGGRHMKVTINEKLTSSIPVDILKNVWQHVCLSYQSDFGAWALYIDSRLVACEAAQTIYGFIIPGGGSVIVGYGTAIDGAPNGFEGEIFGTNMILWSTIERNYTKKNHPQFEQRSFAKNKVRVANNIKYIVLNDLQTNEINNNLKRTAFPPPSSKSYINITTPHGFVKHPVGNKPSLRKPKQIDVSNEKEFLEFFINDGTRTTSDKDQLNFWNIVNQAGNVQKLQGKKFREQADSSTRDLPVISEYETPPLQDLTNPDFIEKSLEIEKPPPEMDFRYKVNQETTKSRQNSFNNKPNMDEIYEVEVPPAESKDKKVYGQWTSSKFAGSVLNYLKNINFHKKAKKVPNTIPLKRVSDTNPYASELRVNMVRPPIQFERKNVILENRYRSQSSYFNSSPLRRLKIKKRDTNQPEINVQILEDDVRSDILKSHAKSQPKNVKVTTRGETTKNVDQRFYRNVDSQRSAESADVEFTARSFNTGKNTNNYELFSNFDLHKSNSLLTALPFLKSLEYFTEDSEDREAGKVLNSQDVYTKSLSHGNKWHNVMSYSNDYTPRRVNMTPEDGMSDIDHKVAEANKRHPSIRLKYKPEINKVIKEDAAILKARQLAMEVSNQSDYNKDSVSILKYNHGFLPGHGEDKMLRNKVNLYSKVKSKTNDSLNQNSFNKHVKIGNALNERLVIGVNAEQKKQSFEGGNARIPDINRYRSDLDHEMENVPSSLTPRICKNIELYDHILYVQPDDSVDMTHILSPVKVKNIGIDFIQQNYKECSLEESALDNNSLLLIHWSKTPVRLFGGAFPKKTTDLCGFF